MIKFINEIESIISYIISKIGIIRTYWVPRCER